MASQNSLILKILTPDGTIFNGEVISANFKSEEGFITILKDHINIVGKVLECKISILQSNDKNIEFNIGEGNYINNNNCLKIIVQNCDSVSSKSSKAIKSKIIVDKYKNPSNHDDEIIEITYDKNDGSE